MMRRSTFRRTLRSPVRTDLVAALVCLTVLSIAAPGLAAQEDKAGGDDLLASFGDVVEVRVMNVDVQAVDGQGQPVLDLGPEEFQLFVDGEATTVTHFALYGSPPPAESVDSTEAAGQPALIGPADIVPEKQPIQLVVLIDNLNIRPQNRKRLVGRLRESVEASLEPDDTVMVASLGDKVEVHLPFSTDRSALGAAIGEVEALPARGGEADAERRAGIDVLMATMDEEQRGTASCTNLLEAAIDQYAQWTIRRTQASLRGMKELIGSLAGLPGRKLLLYVSDGLQIRPGDDLGQAVASFCDSGSTLRSQAYDRSRDFQRLAADANTARVTFMPLEGFANQQSGVGSGLRSSLQDSLRLLADETGGRALLNASNLDDALQPALASAGSYYSLGFRPTAGASDDPHRIEVKISRPGVRVRYRQSFSDKSSEELLVEQLLAAAWLGSGDNPLGAILEDAAPVTPSEEGYQVQLRIGIPIGNMTLIPREGAYEGRFEVYVIARSDDGSQTPMHQTEFAVRIPDQHIEAARDQLYGYQLKLDLPAGEHRLAVGVKDRLSSSLSALSHQVRVGDEVGE